jgi:hypothetical protein
MSFTRLRDFSQLLPGIYADDVSKEQSDPWYKLSLAVEEFNEILKI